MIEDGKVSLRWSERSVAPRTARSKRAGSFGGAMMDLSVRQLEELEATMEKMWLSDGIEVNLTFSV